MRLTLRLLALIGTTICVACGGGGGGGGGSGDAPLPFLTLATFQSAVAIVGQPTPTASSPNAGGGSPNAAGLNDPYGAAGGALYVVDSANHRVLGFSGVPTTSGASATFVLGQPDFAANTPGTSASQLHTPLKAVVAGGRLFVIDLGNSRVLIWDRLPTSNVPADHVIGQANFANSTPNDDDQNGTPDATPSARTLYGPSGLAVADGHLYVVDTNNHRVLIWDSIPSSNFEPADRLLGQQDFNSAVIGTSDYQFQYPNDVAVAGGHTFVADTVNHRVLVWNTAPPAFLGADLVLGQPGFITSAAGAGPTGLTFPDAIHASDSQLFIADYANNRVLVYDAHPTVIEQAPDRVLGQSNFTNTQPNDDDQNGVPDATPSARTFREPTGISGLGKRLFVSDHGNNRVLIFESP